MKHPRCHVQRVRAPRWAKLNSAECSARAQTRGRATGGKYLCTHGAQTFCRLPPCIQCESYFLRRRHATCAWRAAKSFIAARARIPDSLRAQNCAYQTRRQLSLEEQKRKAKINHEKLSPMLTQRDTKKYKTLIHHRVRPIAVCDNRKRYSSRQLYRDLLWNASSK